MKTLDYLYLQLDVYIYINEYTYTHNRNRKMFNIYDSSTLLNNHKWADVNSKALSCNSSLFIACNNRNHVLTCVMTKPEKHFLNSKI